MGLSMSYYQIIRRGKPIAFVTSIAMAHRIVRCRRVGYYAIEKIEIGDGAPSASAIKRHRKPLGAKRSVKSAASLGRSKASAAAEKLPSPKSSKPR
jgi:hypothetical protein